MCRDNVGWVSSFAWRAVVPGLRGWMTVSRESPSCRDRGERRYFLNGKPVLLSRPWLPAPIASGTPIAQLDPGPGGIYARLAEVGHAPVRFREDLRSRMPRPEETERLAIAPGTPVVDICRIALDADETPVEVNEMTADGGAYEFDR